MEDTVEIPPYFLCPISLEIMKDPVIVSTGITYDRQSIEKWLFSGKNDTCPISKQLLISTTDHLTPNVTLRRLIQSWCTLNSSSHHGIQRFPTPKPPVTEIQIVKLLNDANTNPQSPQMQIKCLQRLRSLASYNETNKRSIETAGASQFLASLVKIDNNNVIIRDDALSLLYNLQLSDSGLKTLLLDVKFVESLTCVMRHGSYESRVYAVLLLTSMAELADQIQLTNLPQDIFVELVEILGDQISPKATNATLKLLARVCPLGRNRIKALEAGLVMVLIELLLESADKKRSEMMIVVLELLCQCADGRAEFLKHGAGLAVVSKKILRVSQVASERGLKILYSISKFSATMSVVQEMLSLGVVDKLCLVLQVVESGSKMKERAREILKQNAWAWKNSPCIPDNMYLLTHPCN